MKKLALIAATAFAALVFAAAGWMVWTPYQGFQAERFVEISRGMSTAAIAEQLAVQGVIRFPLQFLLVRALRPSVTLQAGEYHFDGKASAWEVLDRIARGDIYFFEFTVAEGSNIFDIADLLDSRGIIARDAFLRAAEDPSLIRDLVPTARTLEGFLFPSTYRLTHATTAEELCKRMTDTFRREWRKLGVPQADPRRTVTLASLIEKETGVAEERPLVASVFANRLAKGMRLECDPTTIYAALLDHRYRGAIHQSDLKNKNAYNTYQNSGLPPGPIANPGALALAAAVAPVETKYLFFVAKPAGGGHHFSATIGEHEKAVVAYRHAARKKN